MILEEVSREREMIQRLLMSLWTVRTPGSSVLEDRINGPCLEIRKAGGKAVANYNSVVDGDKIVETAVKEFGTVHILINNAGNILLGGTDRRYLTGCLFQKPQRSGLGPHLGCPRQGII